MAKLSSLKSSRYRVALGVFLQSEVDFMATCDDLFVSSVGASYKTDFYSIWVLFMQRGMFYDFLKCRSSFLEICRFHTLLNIIVLRRIIRHKMSKDFKNWHYFA